MSRIHTGLEGRRFEKPDKIEVLTICDETGKIAKTGCQLGVVDGVAVGVVVSEGVVVVVCVGSSLGFVVTSGSCVSFGLFSIIFSVFAGVVVLVSPL